MTGMRISPMQRQTAKLLSQSREQTVEVTVFGDLDATALIAFRKTIQGEESAPSITHFILAALARALARHPHFNAHFEDNALHVLSQADIGFAVSLDNGDLISPVLRDVGALSLGEIAKAARAMSEKARAGDLGLPDLKGAGFTLSSVGQTPAARYATPVIPVPQVAILAAMAIRSEPVVHEGAITTGWILPVSLSFDHRVVNGAAANAFLQTLADEIKRPEALLKPSTTMEGNDQ